MRLFLSFMLLTGFTAAAPGTYTITADSIMAHIEVLADDSLEGRETGEPGARKAADYIISEFIDAGVLPAGSDGNWRQAFEFTKAVEFGDGNSLSIGGQQLELNAEWRPMKQSASMSFTFDEVVPVGFGITDEDDFYDDYEDLNVAGKAVLISRYAPEEDNPHFDFEKHSSLASKIRTAINNDVSGIFFYTPVTHDDTLMRLAMTRIAAKEIPIVYLKRSALSKIGVDPEAPTPFSAEGAVELVRVRDTGYNVVGWVPGRSNTTVVVGAHYDHLGYGGPGSGSRYLGGERLIHNGADDNGSGTSALIELAKYYSAHRDDLHYSMMFIAFSGEEKGLLGSSWYVRHPTRPLEETRMMINMDMIGRLKSQEKGLAIFGTGTSEEFKSFFDTLTNEKIKLTSKESGTGPSDHTSFYNREIPVLGFFTGAHQDYHKPEDDIEFIDPDGIVLVTDLITSIVSHFDTLPEQLTYQKTKDPDAGKRMGGFSVTLGIMPDYISEVKGLRIDGVSSERPAANAGMQTGDVIVKMGDYNVADIYEYMDVLRKYRIGDTLTVVVERDGKRLELPVTF